jgi:hypothetical protein
MYLPSYQEICARRFPAGQSTSKSVSHNRAEAAEDAEDVLKLE